MHIYKFTLISNLGWDLLVNNTTEKNVKEQDSYKSDNNYDARDSDNANTIDNDKDNDLILHIYNT